MDTYCSKGWSIDSDIEKEIERYIQALQTAQHIDNVMDVQSFLNPEKEVIQDAEEEIEEHIDARFNPNIKAESDEKADELSHIIVDETLEALSLLHLFEEQSEDGEPD